MNYLCRRVLIACFTLILPVAAAAQPVTPQNTPQNTFQNTSVKAAENAAICAAFAKIMALQIELYPKAAKTWYDRQGFAADWVRSLAILNGRQDIDPHDMSLILTQYSSWLLGRLAVAQNRSMQGTNAGNNPGFDPGTDPYVKTAHFIGETCAKTYREADLSAQRHGAAMRQQTTLRANPVPPANIASKQEHISMAPASTFRLEQAQSPIRAKSGHTGFVVDLGTFRDADAAKRASDQMQRQFRQKGMDLWLYITPVTVDGRARLRLHSDGIGLGMTKKLCALAWSLQQACVLTPL